MKFEKECLKIASGDVERVEINFKESSPYSIRCPEFCYDSDGDVFIDCDDLDLKWR